MIIEQGICAPALYSKSDVFLRPTAFDGDSVSVRECLQLGIPVVASDAVARPSACRIFPLKDDQKLLQEVNAALNEGFDLDTSCGSADSEFENDLVNVISKLIVQQVQS